VTVSFTDRVAVPPHVMVWVLDNEAVFLNLETEKYFGLDQTRTRMWQLLTTTSGIDTAFHELLDEYDVAPELLRTNLMELLSRHWLTTACSRLSPPMWKLLQRFNALDRRAQSLFLRAVVLLPVVAVSLRLGGFRATQAMFEHFLPTSEDRPRAGPAGIRPRTPHA
jgi:hypothetical protein